MEFYEKAACVAIALRLLSIFIAVASGETVHLRPTGRRGRLRPCVRVAAHVLCSDDMWVIYTRTFAVQEGGGTRGGGECAVRAAAVLLCVYVYNKGRGVCCLR